MNKQVIWKVCQGCSDLNAGQHTANFRPYSLEEAIDRIKWFQHTSESIHVKPTKKRDPIAYTEIADNVDTEVSASVVSKPEVMKLDKKLDALMAKMENMGTNYDKLRMDLPSFKRTVQGRRQPGACKSQEPRKQQFRQRHEGSETRVCYDYGIQGHLSRNCPQKIVAQKSNTEPTGEPLNKKGSG